MWLHSSVGRASHRYFAEVTGSNPVEALIFFRLLLSNCLNVKIYCYDRTSLRSTTAVQIYELFHIYFIYTSHHFTPQLTSPPTCGFIAQLVEHRTRISRRSRVRIPLKPCFFQASSFQLLKLEIYCDGPSSLRSTTAVQIYELFHIYFTSFDSSRET